MAKKVKKKQNSKALHLAAAVCSLCVLFMIVALLLPRQTTKGEFTPPPFEENAQQGTPTVPEGVEMFTPQADGLYLQVSLCRDVVISGKTADVYFTCYAQNDYWIKLRIVDEQGKTLGQTGLLKPGEYVQSITFTKLPENGQRLYYKVMAYEPDTYYSAGDFAVETYARIGG